MMGVNRNLDVLLKKRTREFAIASDLKQQGHVFMSDNRNYHLSIIDYLQEYNCNKKSERIMKTVVLQKNADGISSIDPTRYGRRF